MATAQLLVQHYTQYNYLSNHINQYPPYKNLTKSFKKKRERDKHHNYGIFSVFLLYTIMCIYLIRWENILPI